MAATALAVDRDADLDTVLESTVDTLREAEMGTPTVRALHDLLSAENVASAQKALEDAGVLFIAKNGGGSGVRLRDAE